MIFNFVLQLRDDFIETPPLPPDAIAWVVSDFQRESLEPSSTYQVASTAAPIYTRKTKQPMTDNFTFRTDRRPIKNILTNALTKPLRSSSTHHGIAAEPVTSKDANGNGKNNHTNETINGNGENGTENGIKTAPSYTFYASKKILTRSGFVLHTSRDVLEYLQSWLGVSYPLAKLGKSYGFVK